jgi:hypothetical protein
MVAAPLVFEVAAGRAADHFATTARRLDRQPAIGSAAP